MTHTQNITTNTTQDNSNQNTTTQNTANDYRQRFFVNHSPIRGDIVQLKQSFQTIIAHQPYPQALALLLGEMLAAASLLIGTLKISGRLSIQLQAHDHTAPLRWAMAECDHLGAVRALAKFDGDWDNLTTSNEAFAALGQGVLFINIEHTDPKNPNQTATSYQGIVEKISNNLGECLAHYQKQSAQIDTVIKLTSDERGAAGILIQKLPHDGDDSDSDLWHRIGVLASTLKNDELLNLPANEILYRLYHEENIVLPEPVPLYFACTCSAHKSETALIQLGKQEAMTALDELGEIKMDCGFCGAVYRFNKASVHQLFD